MNKKVIFILVLLFIFGFIFYIMNSNNLFQHEEKEKPIVIDDYNKEFILDFIREMGEHENYLISPYSLTIALNMLKDGTNSETYDEIEKAIGTRTIKDLSMEGKLNIANGLFVRKKYQNLVKTSYTNLLKNKYKAEVLYDEFIEPTVINDWVKENTNGMIERIIDKVDEKIIMGLINAVSLDIRWSTLFDCIRTESETFTKEDGTMMQTEMMHYTYQFEPVRYFEVIDASGVIIPYEKVENSDVELEFVGILPNKDLHSFLKNLTMDKLNNLDNNVEVAGNDLHISVSLPRFSYEYEVKNIKDILKKLGISHIFSETDADFTNMFDISKSNGKYNVSKAIHKTKIELNEKGTKAAAITYFAIAGNAIMSGEPEVRNVVFNRPFLYMIRDKESKEILFLGALYEPNKWNGITCDKEM